MSRFPSYYNMLFPRVQGLKFRLKNWMFPMFKNSKFEGLTVNVALGLFKQCSCVQFFLLFCGTSPYGQLSCYEINFKITNLGLFEQTIFGNSLTRHL